MTLTLSEAVLELSGDSLEVTHAAGAGGSPSLSLLAPLVWEKRKFHRTQISLCERGEDNEQRRSSQKKLTSSGLSIRIRAGRASLLLLVERHLAAASASSVGLRVSLTKTLSTFGLLNQKKQSHRLVITKANHTRSQKVAPSFT